MSANHLIELDGGAGWCVWRDVLIRAAGFPAHAVLELAAPEVAELADRIAELDDRARASRSAAIAVVQPLTEERDGRAKLAQKVLKRLARGELPAESELEPHVAELREIEQARAQVLTEIDRAYAEASVRASDALRRIGASPAFREALVWQSPHALHTGVDRLLAHDDVTTKDARRRLQLIANYLQRYAVKNDTIGFFGPVGWGELVSSDAVSARPGPALLRERRVSFEHWTIDELARSIAASPGVRPHLAPRLVPSAAVSGTTLRYGFDKSMTMPPAIARVVAACDGERSAIEIARELVADPTLELSGESEVLELLEHLVERKLVVWTLEPAALLGPEHELRRLLERIAEPEIRAREIDKLDRLVAARARVASAAGDEPRLAETLDELAAIFVGTTGAAASRRGGETYAARTLVYEDCVRDFDLAIGTPVHRRLGPVLALVGQSARWFTFEIATRYRARMQEAHRELGAGQVSYLQFMRAIQDLLPEPGAQPRIFVEVAAELDRRWAAVLDLDMTRSREDRTAAELADRVARELAAPGPGWPGVRHVCPDVLVVARSIDQIARGEHLLVLGELHLANTNMARCVIANAPDGLLRAFELDLPDPRVLMAEPRHQITRVNDVSWAARDFDIELGESKSWRPRSNVLRAVDLVVEETPRGLVVRDTRLGRSFDAIAAFESYLTAMSLNHFRPAPRGPHLPRVTIDGVVLCREQWRFAREELPLIEETRGARQFMELRAWARRFGLPRWAFYRVPGEEKPVYVDFASPIYVEMLAKAARKTTTLTLSEMLPSVEETWLPDAQGRMYTCELRMVALDPRPWATGNGVP